MFFKKKYITLELTLKNGAKIKFKCENFNLTGTKWTVDHCLGEYPQLMACTEEIIAIVQLS